MGRRHFSTTRSDELPRPILIYAPWGAVLTTDRSRIADFRHRHNICPPTHLDSKPAIPYSFRPFSGCPVEPHPEALSCRSSDTGILHISIIDPPDDSRPMKQGCFLVAQQGIVHGFMANSPQSPATTSARRELRDRAPARVSSAALSVRLLSCLLYTSPSPRDR